MFLAVESFLLQDECRDAIVEQRQAGVMGPAYNPENVHGDTTVSDRVFHLSGVLAEVQTPLTELWGTGFGDIHENVAGVTANLLS